ncbi:MAG: hypothetical protein MUF31_16190 [Akkermansiaceae bacterium]|jgi:hypothetical protein|nr:hypothetical protein [Akkermansiaceae bacterium]
MKAAYKSLQAEVRRGFGVSCHPLMEALFRKAVEILSNRDRVTLHSKVEGKSYFAFDGRDKISRPICDTHFALDPGDAWAIFSGILAGQRHLFKSEEITAAIYQVAISCCAAIDLQSRGDQKTPGTIFEWLCAAIMQATLGVVPMRSLPVLNLDLEGKLPTDFIFDLGAEKPKFHLPVKTSTRERIIQVWAHQRVLDGVYGVGRFLAIPMILTETKLDAKKREVVEICLPWQWRLYQMHIATLWNVCYLDPPASYLALDRVYPRISVSSIGDFLVAGGRLDELLDAHGLGRN